MNLPYLIDTDVLIEYLRGHSKAVIFLEKTRASIYLSSITIAELYAGVRDGVEKEILDEFIQAFQIIPIDHNIARKGGLLRRDYGKSHGVGLADAINAAAAENVGATLVTMNRKHYPMLKSVNVPY